MSDAGVTPDKIDEVVLVGGQTRMPRIQQLVKEFFGRDPHQGVNPDEVVAIGAAIQGAVLTGEQKDVLLLDVSPLSLGIETLGGVSTVLIPRNTTIPTKKSETFSTAEDSQTTVEIHVLQGERELAQYNKTIGKFQLTGIPPAPRGMPQVEVTFDIDANGILHVTAKDKATGKEQKIRIEASSGLSDAEIKKMTSDAEAHAAEDKAKRDQIDARNKLDSLTYEVDKNSKEWSDRLSAELKGKLESAVDRARKALRGEDMAEISAARTELEKAYSEAGQSLYAQGQQSAGEEATAHAAHESAADNPKGTDPKNEAVEADYEIVDDTKK
jgi:molecular chaperone DnaK